jgi:hypothetical protein
MPPDLPERHGLRTRIRLRVELATLIASSAAVSTMVFFAPGPAQPR